MVASYLAAFFTFLSLALTSADVESYTPRFRGRLPSSYRVVGGRSAALQSSSTQLDLNDTLIDIGRIYGATFVSGIEENLPEIARTFGPVVAASPKNEHGRLDDIPARYALRRVLMERHSWDMPSLGEDEVDEEEITVSSQSPSLGWSLPGPIRQAIQKRTSSRGAGISELSLFVAALEQTVFQGLPQRLEIAYRSKLSNPEEVVERETVESIIDLYMGAYICGEDLSRMTLTEQSKFHEDLSRIFSKWAEAKSFFREIQRFVTPNAQDMSFSNVVEIVTRIEKQLPLWNAKQCTVLKDNLMSMELEGSGRLRLLDFYNGALHKDMVEFREKRKYLRSLGALDESDPLEPRVIISNYLDGPSNCIAETKDFSLCCVDECGSLYGHIERQVRKPEASPDELISIVKHLASPTMRRARLSEAILRRIHDIADHHNGVVPLHGSLFAEWMHFAYPRECTYPQMFGPAHSETVGQWARQHGSPNLRFAEMRKTVEELEKLELERMARANASTDGDMESTSGGTCWSWDRAEINITYDGEDGPRSLLEGVMSTQQWMATFAFCSCFAVYISKLFNRSKFPKSF
eukprot:TRINITY_DN133_c0_g2_i7.p1 TRINITY_DN133_c0_g2~~TRINITY_DN133_c0_g2_i7.p1  ORF type:complete len:578 (-),score=71.32 TRINITY_DN133_c0_g2_i7:118-1851(-)